MKKNLKKTITLSFLGFAFLQGAFLYNSVNEIQSMVEKKSKEIEGNYKVFRDFQVAKTKYDQKEIINQFNRAQNTKSYVINLLMVAYVRDDITAQNTVETEIDKEWKKKYPEEYEQSRSKVTSETRKFIHESYLKDPKNGIAKDREYFKQISCLPINIPCILIRKKFDEANNKNIDHIEYRIDVNLYNINHMDEYLVWYSNFVEELQKGNYSPGDIAMEKKLNK